jgi:UDP-glucose:(heptosyl)LPS alpha-1,3-glucosyltransferase
MTKLALVRQKYRPDGGAERFVASALDSLKGKADLNISVITRQWLGEAAPHYHVISCNPKSWGRVSREKGFAKAAQSLFKQFDLVQSHERIPGCDIFRAGDGVHKCWLKHKARIMSPLRATLMRLDPFHRYIMQAEKEMFEHPKLKAVICNSIFVKQEICREFQISPEKIHVIYNAVDLKRFNPKTKTDYRQSVRQKLKIPLETNLMVYVGSGFERKGLAIAIQAIAQTRSHLIVIGQDKQVSKYYRLTQQLGCTERIHFMGIQKKTEQFYASADGLILPTLYDPFPNVILEAMASGLGVITSTTCGGAEIIQNGKNGFVCDALDLENITQAIQHFESLENSNKLGVQARLTVEPFTSTRLAQQLNSLYQNLLKTSS